MLPQYQDRLVSVLRREPAGGCTRAGAREGSRAETRELTTDASTSHREIRAVSPTISSTTAGTPAAAQQCQDVAVLNRVSQLGFPLLFY